MSDILLRQIKFLLDSIHRLEPLRQTLVLQFQLLEVALVLSHVLNFFSQLSDLLLKQFRGQLIIPLDCCQLVDLDIEFTFGFSCLLLDVKILCCDDILMSLSHFVFF